MSTAMAALKIPKGTSGQSGGIGIWWAARNDELEENENEFAVYQYTDEGWKVWTCFTALQNSCTRCELGASLVAMLPAKAVNIGIDNKGVITNGTSIIHHVESRRCSTRKMEPNYRAAKHRTYTVREDKATTGSF